MPCFCRFICPLSVAGDDSGRYFVYHAVLEPKAGTIYVDYTGNFPIRSMEGNTAICVLYNWSSNAILVTPVKKIKNETILAAFKTNIEYLKKWNFTPVFNIIDNVATKAVKSYLEDKGIKMQLVKPHNHHSNAAERAIQNFKNHTIAGLCTCNEYFPSVLWCKLIKQSQDTLNMLRTLRVHPILSAYHVIEGPHDFNFIPFDPPGTRTTILNPPETRNSWGPRAMDAWYLIPAYYHYRAWLFH